jgi:hypothetical protein
LSPARKEPAIEVYGNAGLGKAVAAGPKEWIELGKPKFTGYGVEVADPSSEDVAEGWVIRRPNVALWVSL